MISLAFLWLAIGAVLLGFVCDDDTFEDPSAAGLYCLALLVWPFLLITAVVWGLRK